MAKRWPRAVAQKRKSARPGGTRRAQLSTRRGIRNGGPHAQSILDSDEAQDCQAVSDVQATHLRSAIRALSKG